MLLAGLLAVLAPVAAAGAAPATTVSLTFDDGDANQYSNALPALSAHGMNGTFFVNSAKIGGSSEYMTWSQVHAVASAGNEIGGHTLDHANLAAVEPSEAERQVCNDRVNLINQGFAPTDFAYPYGAFNPTVASIVSACGYNSGRGLGGLVSPFDGACASGCPDAETIPPPNAYAMRTPDSVISTMTLSDLQTLVTQAENSGGGWVPIVFHDVCENACSTRSISPALFNSFLTWLGEQQTAGAVSVKTVKQVIGGSFQPGVSGPPPQGTSLLNASLETAGTAGLPACWQTGGFGSNTPAYTRTSDAHTGSWAEQLTVSNYVSGDAKMVSMQDQGGCAPSVTPLRAYTVGTWYKATTNTTLIAYYRDQVGAWHYLATSPAFPASAGWTQALWTTPAMPSEATGISFGPALAGNGSVTVDDLSLTMAPPTVAIAGLSAGNTYAGLTNLTAEAGAGTDHVEFLVNGTPIGTATGAPWTVPWNSLLAASGTTAITARAFDSKGAFSSATVNVSIDNSGSAIRNSSLEWETGSNSLPDCWEADGFGTNSSFFTRTSDAHSGSAAERVDITSYSSGDRKLLQKQDSGLCAPAVVPGREYTLSSWFKSSIKPFFVVFRRTQAGEWLFFASGPTARFTGSQTSWTQASWTTPPVPAGTTNISFGLVLDQVGFVTVDDMSMSCTGLNCDLTAPSSSASAPALSGTNSISVGYTAADNTGGSGLAKVDLYAKAPGQGSFSKVATATGSAGSGSFSYTAAGGDGTYSFYTVATDAAGNAEAAPVTADASTLVDTTQPSSSATAPAQSASTAISVGYTAADSSGGSGLVEVDLWAKAPGQASYAKVATATGAAGSGSFSYTAAAGDGTYSFYTVATDAAGNAEAAPAGADATTLLDTTAPASSATAPALTAGGALTIGYTASDENGSGVAEVDLYVKAPGQSSYAKASADTNGAGSGSFSYTPAAGDGSYSFYTLATDRAGNAEGAPVSADASTLVDSVAPGSSASAPALSGTNAISVGYTAADNAGGSGLAEVDLYVKAPGQSSYVKAAADTSGAGSGSFSYTAGGGDGTYSFYTLAIDAAGNTEAAPEAADASTLVDATAPTSSASSPALSATSSFSVSWTASDGSGSGLAEVDLYARAPGQSTYTKIAADTSGAGSGSFSYTAAAGDGTYSFYTVATDQAGNGEGAPAGADTSTSVDTTAPTSSASAPQISGSGAVSVSYTASDGAAGSGVAEVDLYVKAPGQSSYVKASADTSGAGSGSFSYTPSAGDGSYAFYTVATDGAGNSESAPASADATTSVDSAAPSSSASAPALSGKASVTVQYTAADNAGGSGLAEVDLYVKAPGQSSYAKAAADTSGAGSGSFSYTAGGGDGTYSFYTLAKDAAGNTEAAPEAAATATVIDTTAPASSASSPATSSASSWNVTYTASDGAGSGLAQVDLYLKVPGQSVYSKIASDTSGAGSGSFSFKPANGDGTYSFYTVATDKAGNAEAAPASADASTAYKHDTTAPAAKATAQAYSNTASWTVSYTASDNGGGDALASVELWVKVPGAKTYARAATNLGAALSGGFTYTASAGEGSYAFYVIATDESGNREAAPTSPDASTRYDAVAPTPFTMSSVQYLRATPKLTLAIAPTDSGSGMSNVTYQYRVAGSSAAWATACAAIASPWSCGWNTTTGATPDGQYELRATAVDKAGNSTLASNAPISPVTIDNTAPSAISVKTANVGGGTAGRPEAGDTVTFTFSEAMSPTSLLEGWNGTATPVQVKFVAKSAKDTTLAVWNAAGTVQAAVANPLDLGAAYVPSGGATFAASMTQSGPAVTVTLGSLTAGGVLAAPATAGTLTWTPNSKATDFAGNKVSTAKVTAAGPAF